MRLEPVLPPPELRYRVAATEDGEAFKAVGRRCADDLRSAFARVGHDLSHAKILDFGCGCGRTLRWFIKNRPSLHLPKIFSRDPKFYGSDIDSEAIAWCRRHLRDATFETNGHCPPLAFAESSFDGIYAISVFSHLDERHIDLWLMELFRVAKPGATLALSVQGRSVYAQVPQSDVAALDSSGTLFVQNGFWSNRFPAWYGDIFFTPEGAERVFGKHFSFLDYIAGGINGHQDLVLLRKP